MKKIVALITVIVLTLSFLVGCSKPQAGGSAEKQTIKLGVTSSNPEIWRYVAGILKEENIELEIINFGDYIRPNLALAEKEIDANAFQTVAYFEKFKEDHNLKLTAIGDTVFAPMGIYSHGLVSLDELKDGGKVALPNDATNGGRALILLQNAGLIKLKEGVGLLPTVRDVAENPKNLELIELVATQIPRSLQDVDIAVINNGVAVDAGFSPVNDSIFREDVDSEDVKPYINIIAVRAEDGNNPLLKRLVEVYQTEETKQKLNEIHKGAVLPAF